MSDDLLTTVKAALATVADPYHEPEYSTHAISQTIDDDGNISTVVITWDDIRALVARIEQAESALAALREQRCEWAEDADGNWDTSCDNKYCFFTGGPTDNGMKFCCYCGSRLVERARREP